MSGRGYFVSVPNTILDIGLSEAAIRLYLRIKRAAGDAPGARCDKGIATLAKESRMGRSLALEARDELATPRPEIGGKPLIVVHSTRLSGAAERHEIEVVDVWPDNRSRYQKERSRPGISSVPKQERPFPNGNGCDSQMGTDAVPKWERIGRTFKNEEEDTPLPPTTDDDDWEDAILPVMAATFSPWPAQKYLGKPEDWVLDCIDYLKTEFGDDLPGAVAFVRDLKRNPRWSSLPASPKWVAEWLGRVLIARHTVDATAINGDVRH